MTNCLSILTMSEVIRCSERCYLPTTQQEATVPGDQKIMGRHNQGVTHSKKYPVEIKQFQWLAI